MRQKIAVLSRNFSTTGGGAERYAVAVVEQLAQRHEVHVFTQQVGNRLAGVTYHRVALRLQRPRWINQWIFAIATGWATRKGFDVVHSHENLWHGNVQTVHVLPVKYSLSHGKTAWALWRAYLKAASSLRLLTYLWLEKKRFTIQGGRRIVVTSEALRLAMLEAYPAVFGAMEVISPGVVMPEAATGAQDKQQARAELGLPSQGTCVLFVGNDFQKKGLPSLIKALAQLPPDCFVAVVGHPRQRESMQQLAQELGVLPRLVFLGALRDMENAYRAADVLVHPTLQDSYAMVVLEAMAHGVPVVVSGLPYCGIAGELTHLAQAWILSDPQDADALVQAVGTVLGDTTLAQGLVAQGLAFARAHSWAHAGYQHEQLFQRFGG